MGGDSSTAAEFEESTEWYFSGATPVHWMAQQLDVCVATAREWIRMGKALRNLQVVEEAFASQHPSFAKVRALTRLAQPDTEVELVELARAVPAGRLGHALAAWTQRREDHRERAARHERERSLRHRVEPDGMVTFTVRLAPEDAAATLAAIEASMMRRSLEARSPNVTESDTEGGNYATAVASASPAQQRADAFVEYDHVPSFDETDHTVVDETELRCAPCHRRRHERERRGQGPPAT